MHEGLLRKACPSEGGYHLWMAGRACQAGGPRCPGHRGMEWVAPGSGPRVLAQWGGRGVGGVAGLTLADHRVQKFFGQSISPSVTPLLTPAVEASGLYSTAGPGACGREVERPSWFVPVVGRENPAQEPWRGVTASPSSADEPAHGRLSVCLPACLSPLCICLCPAVQTVPPQHTASTDPLACLVLPPRPTQRPIYSAAGAWGRFNHPRSATRYRWLYY